MWFLYLAGCHKILIKFRWNRVLLCLSIGASDNEMYVRLRTDRYFCTILYKFGILRQVFIEVPKVKFHINSSSGTSSDNCGQTDRQTDEQDEAKGCFHECTHGPKLHYSSKLSDWMELYSPPHIVLVIKWIGNEMDVLFGAYVRCVRETAYVHFVDKPDRKEKLRRSSLDSKEILTHWGRGHLNCLNARYRGF
jgi:hypothetical protein